MDTWKIVLIIYLIGYVCAYYSIRWMREGHNTWDEVWNSLGWSLLSWLACIITLYMGLSIKYGDEKPPKWL